jgi:hypothetical protein
MELRPVGVNPAMTLTNPDQEPGNTRAEIPDELVDHLLERLTARIDGVGGHLGNPNEAPPTYRS